VVPAAAARPERLGRSSGTVGIAHVSYTKKGAMAATVLPGSAVPFNRVHFASNGISALRPGAEAGLALIADGTYIIDYVVSATPALGGLVQAALMINGTTPLPDSQHSKPGRINAGAGATVIKGHLIAAFPDAQNGIATGAGTVIEIRNTGLTPFTLSGQMNATNLRCVQVA
jgi:hypothetical protein